MLQLISRFYTTQIKNSCIEFLYSQIFNLFIENGTYIDNTALPNKRFIINLSCPVIYTHGRSRENCLYLPMARDKYT